MKGGKKKETPKIVEPFGTAISRLTYSAEVYADQVYDGDTLQDVNFAIYPEMRVTADLRLAGIQAPEVRTTDKAMKKKGYAARDALRRLLEKHFDKVHFNLLGRGSFGRLIAEVWVYDSVEEKHIHVNKWLMDQGYAKAYKKR